MKLNLLSISFSVALLMLPPCSRGQVTLPTATASPIQTENRSAAGAHSEGRSTTLAAVPQDFAKMTLAPGFLLGIKVLYDQDFDGSYRIDQHGTIVLPELGAIHVAGETSAEARDQIAKMLVNAQLMKDPQVAFQILEYTAPEVNILGEVATPGRYPLLVPHNLIDVLGLAGGMTITAGDEIQITRGSSGDEKLIHYSKGKDPESIANVMIDPGDTVVVRRAGIIYVLGGVTRPGGYVMQEEGRLSVLQAIALANGTSLPASIRTVHIFRKNSDGSEVDISIPYKKITRGESADYLLQASDVLYVPTNKFKSALLGGGAGILAAVSSASIYAATIY